MDRLRNCCCCGEKTSAKKGDRLPISQKFFYGVGHILNDLAANAWFSYLIIYLTKVARLSNSHTGLVVMLGQVTDGVCTPITAILNDKTVCRYGRRKIWHLFGTICISLTFPLLFTRLLADGVSDSLKLAYYIGVAAVFQFGWGCVQISHLSLIPEIAVRESEKFELNAIRSALRFVCGIFVFAVTWILLGRSSEASISSTMWKQFMYLALIIVVTGAVFSVIFHVGLKEPPSDALLCWIEDRKNGKHKNSKLGRKGSERKALLTRVVYQPPSVSRRSGASPAVVMTIFEKEEKKTADNGGEIARPESQMSVDSGRTQDTSHEIIDRNPVHRRSKTKKQWLCSPGLYKVNHIYHFYSDSRENEIGVVYICTRMYVNVSQSYLPLYLTETMQFEKESIAYFPLVVLVTGVLASTVVQPLNRRLGSKITFCLGAVMAIGASIWFFVQNVDGRKAVYATSILMGSGGSVMLVTSLSLIAQLIGHDKSSGAFVYGFIGFFDKVFSGAIFKIIQDLNPQDDQRAECLTCDEYVRRVQSIVPGSAAVLGLLSVIVFFESIFVCKRRATMVDAEVQVNLDEIKGEDDNSSSGIDTASITEKPNIEDCNQENQLENGESQQRTYDHSFESRNFSRPRRTRAIANEVAIRLASPFLPSPIFDRRTIL